jgi:sulfite exporter TauE/SafE
MLDVIMYNLGRVISYTIIGALAAWAVELFAEAVSPITKYAGVVAAIFFAAVLLVQGVFLARGQEWSFFSQTIGVKFNKLISRSFFRQDSLTGVFFLGFLTAALPCMTLSSAVAAAAMTGSAEQGALVMFAFSIGTVPAMLVTPLFASDIVAMLGRRVSVRTLRLTGALLLFIAAIFTFLRIIM